VRCQAMIMPDCRLSKRTVPHVHNRVAAGQRDADRMQCGASADPGGSSCAYWQITDLPLRGIVAAI